MPGDSSRECRDRHLGRTRHRMDRRGRSASHHPHESRFRPLPAALSPARRTATSTKSTAVTRYPRRASAIALVPVPHPISRTVFPGNNPASRTRTNSALGIPESHGVSPVRYDFSNSPPPIGSPPAFKTSIDGCLLSAEGGRRLDRFDLAAVVRDGALDHVALQQQPVKGIED